MLNRAWHLSSSKESFSPNNMDTSSRTPEKVERIILPFNEQKTADIVKYRLKDLELSRASHAVVQADEDEQDDESDDEKCHDTSFLDSTFEVEPGTELESGSEYFPTPK
ncbi:hypothetical protein AC249_AIPGENE5471 [Exaiptasia diaphana]|nr:hypothetical protein AC249_AIPGENE5471 [Exaiptasia diaphana]